MKDRSRNHTDPKKEKASWSDHKPHDYIVPDRGGGLVRRLGGEGGAGSYPVPIVLTVRYFSMAIASPKHAVVFKSFGI